MFNRFLILKLCVEYDKVRPPNLLSNLGEKMGLPAPFCRTNTVFTNLEIFVVFIYIGYKIFYF